MLYVVEAWRVPSNFKPPPLIEKQLQSGVCGFANGECNQAVWKKMSRRGRATASQD